MTDTRTPLLEITDLSIEFPSSPLGVAAVKHVDLRLEHGASLGVVGESGSGKSTVCLAVLGLTPPGTRITGSIRFQGTELLGLPERALRPYRGKSIGLVYQDPMAALNPVKTIGAQLAEPLRIHLGMSRRDARARSVELLERVGITDAADKLRKYPHEFSGGMRQRVVIAMAVACNPALLIADEPTTALDVSVQAQVLELMQNLTAELDISLLFVSHDLGVIAGVADDVAVMRSGEVVEHGRVRDVFERPQHEYTRQLIGRVRDLETPAAHLSEGEVSHV